MADRTETDTSNLMQSIQSNSKVQELINRIKNNFNLNSIVENKKYSRIKGLQDQFGVLDEIRDAFRDKFLQFKKIANIVALIIKFLQKTLHLLRGVSLLAFQNGLSNLEKIVGKDNYGIFIPIDIVGSGEAMLEETVLEDKSSRRMIFKFQIGSELLITGRCSIWLPAQSKVLCVVLCAGKDKGSQTVTLQLVQVSA